MGWLEEAQQKREEHRKIRETVPKPEGDAWHRGAIIAALTALGCTSAMMSGEHVEGDEFFGRLSTEDLRTFLWDHWFLQAMAKEPYDITPPDVADVPEPELKPSSCRCNCGYSCDRKCGLPIMECTDQHYVQDCDHDWSGPWEEYENGGSVTCAICGTSRIGHDMVCGP